MGRNRGVSNKHSSTKTRGFIDYLDLDYCTKFLDCGASRSWGKVEGLFEESGKRPFSVLSALRLRASTIQGDLETPALYFRQKERPPNFRGLFYI